MKTFSIMMITPTPIGYLELLTDNHLLPEESARQTLLRYIHLYNNLRGLQDNIIYSITPYHEMTLSDLKTFCLFLEKYGLLPRLMKTY